MAKCDVCGKNSLMPQKLGAVKICKVCFIKAGGPLWKRDYEKYDDAEKNRIKALEAAEKLNFPQLVITAINDFFVVQMNSMTRCGCCGQTVKNLRKLEQNKICEQCWNKINISEWRKNEYEDNAEVEKNRQKLLKVASANNFSSSVVEAINKHFDSKIQQGLVCTVSSSKGQKLKVFESYCVLTTQDSFDVEEISKEYGKVLKKMQPKERLISNTTAKSLARSVLTGGIIQAGINLATSAAINAAADAIVPEKGMFKVVNGKFRFDYTEYDHVDFHKAGDEEIGFIRFHSNRYKDNPAEDIVFFFGGSNKAKETVYNEICKWIAHTKQPQSASIITETHQPQQIVHSSEADEILKFKQLLDMGIITQDEFEAKKKQILGI